MNGFSEHVKKSKNCAHQFWRWIKPYLGQFHRWRKRIWKKYHINKLILLIGLIFVLITSIYLFVLAKQANVETLKSGLSQSTVIYDKTTKRRGRYMHKRGLMWS